MRSAGTYASCTTVGEPVQAFVPQSLPSSDPASAEASFSWLNHAAELVRAWLSGVSRLVPSVDWLFYSVVGKEALLTSQIEGTQAR